MALVGTNENVIKLEDLKLSSLRMILVIWGVKAAPIKKQLCLESIKGILSEGRKVEDWADEEEKAESWKWERKYGGCSWQEFETRSQLETEKM